MNQSDEIKDLVTALAKAQSVMQPAIFNKTNPHLKNKYADFTSCMAACREPLSANGLAVMQYCETVNEKLLLVTMLAHTSGQWIKSFFPLTPKDMTSQSIGSALTYAKRYSLSALLGIVADAEDDDDGEAAMGRGNAAPQAKKIENIISASQATEIVSLYNKLPSEKQPGFISYLNSEIKAPSIDKISSDKFDTVKKVLIKAVA